MQLASVRNGRTPNQSMCGICGIAYRARDQLVAPDRLTRMRDAIAHRGPDGGGNHCDGPIGLGHRRLSVIDLAGGSQPLSNEDGTVWVTYNGEIYNYRQLTDELTSRNHRFRTRCDTEVLVHGYEEYGVDFVRRLDGMFAFALHDVPRRRVVLARDHLGIKPLFYVVTPEGLFFASEPKALIAAGACRPSPDLAAVQEYLMFRYVAGSRSFFDGVHRLPPGHVAVWEDGHLTVRAYWSVGEAAPASRLTPHEAGSALERQLDSAVKAQLMSDVPLGTFCSGGVDSGVVTALASRHVDAPLHTFSVGFEDPAWDESALAQDTADRVGTRHHTIVARAESLASLLPELIRLHDEPLSHPNSVPLYLLSKFAREFVTVVLTGEGADELFCGYPRYQLARAAYRLRSWPAAATRALAAAVGVLPGHRAKLAARLASQSYTDALLLNSAYVDPGLVAALTGRSVEAALDQRRTLVAASLVAGDPVASLSRYEMQTYLVCALDRMDRMAMAHGLEGRVPFLAVPLVEWGLSLTGATRLSGLATKQVVKAAARGHLGQRILQGRKSGFGMPLAAWFRDPALASLLERLRDPRHPAAALFEHRVLHRLVTEHASGAADHSEVLWLLVNVFVWYEVHDTKVAEPAPRTPPLSLGHSPAPAR